MNKLLISLILLQLPFGAFGSAAVSAARCPEILSRATIPPNREQIDRMIHSLSALKLSLDSAKASGADSLGLTALMSDYNKKEKELIGILERNKVMTRAELHDRMKQEIANLQNTQNAEQETTDRTKQEEERQRREQEEQIK